MNYELQFRQSFAKPRRKVGSNYAREGRIKKCVSRERGRGLYRGGGAAKGWPAKGSPPLHCPLFIPIMVITPSST
jgi:hypothetical protein